MTAKSSYVPIATLVRNKSLCKKDPPSCIGTNAVLQIEFIRRQIATSEVQFRGLPSLFIKVLVENYSVYNSLAGKKFEKSATSSLHNIHYLPVVDDLLRMSHGVSNRVRIWATGHNNGILVTTHTAHCQAAWKVGEGSLTFSYLIILPPLPKGLGLNDDFGIILIMKLSYYKMMFELPLPPNQC